MNLVLYAAGKNFLEFKAPFKNGLGRMLAHELDWDDLCCPFTGTRASCSTDRKGVVVTDPWVSNLWQFATVHIGFAGGRLLRLVAKNLAELLQTPSSQNPRKLAFHAMVAALNEDDFESDPNNFSSYFLQKPLLLDISFVPIAAPGIVEVKHR